MPQSFTLSPGVVIFKFENHMIVNIRQGDNGLADVVTYSPARDDYYDVCYLTAEALARHLSWVRKLPTMEPAPEPA